MMLSIADPGNLVALLLLGFIFVKIRQRPDRLSWIAAASLSVLLLVPIGPWALLPLVERIPPSSAPAKVDGLLVLGGGTDNPERFLTAAVLSRRFPHARMVFSDIEGGGEARAAFLNIGVDPALVTIESHARNTWENIWFSWCLVKPKPDQAWYMVTNSYHMPRAVGVAQKIGWNVAPWPAGPASFRPEFALQFTRNLRALEVAAHEWVGLAWYFAMGRSAALFPRFASPAAAGAPLNGGALHCPTG
jgi:uncharacterized SAM-binding protein YcdF (DUF218 family)